MKKLLIVLSALVLAVGFAVPALAVDVDVTGELTVGGITGFDEEKVANGWGNGYFDATASIDEYNDVVFRWTIADGDVYQYVWLGGQVYLKSDVGAYLDLPIGLTAQGGYFGFDSRKFEVTGHAWERKYRPGVFGGWITDAAFLFNLDFGMATLDVGVDFEAVDPVLPTQDYVIMLSVPELGPASLEAGYFILDNDDFEGAFTANAKAEGLMDMINVAAGFGVDTKDVPDYAEWWYGIGAEVMYSMFTVGAALNGDEAYSVDRLALEGEAAIGDEYGVKVGVGLNLDTDNPAANDESLGGFEVSAYYKPGASEWVVGYLYCKDGQYKYNAPMVGPAAAPDERGGLFLKCDIDI
jgi:hypothetical protein